MTKQSIKSILFLTFLICLSSCNAQAWSGKVVGVTDGDTIKVLKDGKHVKVNLYGIDAPDKGQPFGRQAKKFTTKFAAHKTVKVEPVDLDRNGRIVGLVTVYGKSLNKAIIRSGYAWVNRDSCNESFCFEWAKLENLAKKSKSGLWIQHDPIPPWKLRKTKNKKTINSHRLRGGKGVIYHGNRRSYVFHDPSCRYYGCQKCTELFHSRDEAINARYRPCEVCNP